MHFRFLLLFALLTGCTASNPWKLETISTGDRSFDSARLTYSDNDSPLRFEIVRMEANIEAFLNLKKYKFTPSDKVKIEFTIDGEKTIETVPFLEGKMRLRFPQETALKVIEALQEGQEVVIMVDGFEQRIYPELFKKQYEKLAGESAAFRNPFKGLFDP